MAPTRSKISRDGQSGIEWFETNTLEIVIDIS